MQRQTIGGAETAGSFFLNSADPLFPKIQKSFMEKEMALFGTDHIYSVDPFNEMDPPSWEPDYLANVSQNIYASLRQADPPARRLSVQITLFRQSAFQM